MKSTIDPAKLPPDPEGMNDQRSAWADTAVTAYRRATRADAEDAFGDLIGNLMHWADRNSYDFGAALLRAQDHYEVETTALPTPFDAYEIHGIRGFGRGRSRFYEQVPDAKSQFWSLFGHVTGEGLHCIGDFSSREFAEEILARIAFPLPTTSKQL